jgi:hypothetical protein
MTSSRPGKILDPPIASKSRNFLNRDLAHRRREDASAGRAAAPLCANWRETRAKTAFPRSKSLLSALEANDQLLRQKNSTLCFVFKRGDGLRLRRRRGAGPMPTSYANK